MDPTHRSICFLSFFAAPFEIFLLLSSLTLLIETVLSFLNFLLNTASFVIRDSATPPDPGFRHVRRQRSSSPSLCSLSPSLSSPSPRPRRPHFPLLGEFNITSPIPGIHISISTTAFSAHIERRLPTRGRRRAQKAGSLRDIKKRTASARTLLTQHTAVIRTCDSFYS